MKKYDVAIIGAGTSGLAARRQVAKATDNYIVIDDGILGTTCARVGCMPSKVLIQAANDFHRRHKFSTLGIHGADKLTVNQDQVMAHVRKLRDRFVSATMGSYDGWQETHLLRKRAKFIDKNTLDLGDEKIWAKKIIIATGSRPILPASWEPLRKYLVDTNQFFELETLPKDMAVIGLGVIGIELGQALHRLGVNVAAVGRGKSIGGASEPEIVDYIADSFSEEMNISFGGVKSLSERNGKLIVETEENEIAVDRALLAMGRRPNVDQLGLEEIGIELNDRGLPSFDISTMQIGKTNIYLTGDANGDRPLLHEAADDGAIAGFNSVAQESLSFKRRTFLGVTFSDPNIATVGKNYRQLTNQGIEFITGRVSFEGQGRSIVKLKEKGILKIFADGETGEILGSEIFGPDGEHLAHLLAWAIQQKMTVHQVLSMPFYHPVVEEGVRTALRHLASQLPEKRGPLDIAVCQEHPTSRCNE